RRLHPFCAICPLVLFSAVMSHLPVQTCLRAESMRFPPSGPSWCPTASLARSSSPGHKVVTVPRRSGMPAKRLTLQQRRDIFHALVSTQDLGLMSVAQSREHVSKQFEITDSQLRQIEEEGLDKEWPPLNEAVQSVGEM